MQWLRSRRRLLLVRLLPVLAAVWLVLPMHSCPLAIDSSGKDCPSHELSADVTLQLAPCCDIGPTGVVPDLPLNSLQWDTALPSLLAYGWVLPLVSESDPQAATHPPPPTAARRPLHLTKQVLLI